MILPGDGTLLHLLPAYHLPATHFFSFLLFSHILHLFRPSPSSSPLEAGISQDMTLDIFGWIEIGEDGLPSLLFPYHSPPCLPPFLL